MNRNDFTIWLQTEIAALTDYDPWEAADTIREARRYAQALGFPTLIPKCQTDAQAVPVARDILSHALAVIAPPDSGPLTVKQAAERLGISAKTLYRMVEQGKLRCQRVGRTIRIRPNDLTQPETGFKYLRP